MLGFYEIQKMKTLKTAILISFLSVSFNSFADLNTGLVAYWSFDNCTAKDNSGNGHDGTINGNPQCVTGRKGKGFYFDGIDDYISVPLAQDLKFNPNIQSFSTTIWAKPVKMNFFDQQFASVPFGSDFIDTYTYLLTSQGFEAKRNAYTAEGGSYISSPLWDKDNWHLFSGVWKVNGSQITAYFYIDGVLSATKNLDAIPNGSYPWNGLFIGATAHLHGGRSEFFGDEIRIYNRALTAAEITALYHQGVKPTKNGISSNTGQCINNANWCVHPTFTVFGVTKDSDIPINLINTSYIVDGLNRNVSNGKVNITANLYNRGYADAMLDIYDKQGNWTNFIRLDGNRPETSVVGDIWDKWTTTYDSYNDEYSTFDPRDAGSSKKLNIGFSIPNGGYAVLSENSETAIGNMVQNTALTIFDEPKWIAEKGNAKKKLVSIFANAAINEGLVTLAEQLKKAVESNNQAEASSITIEMTQKLSKITYKVFKENATEVINIIGDKAAQRFAKKTVKFFHR